MNNKGQFSIIAALFVAVILISSVMVTYSAIRYGSNQNQPQIISVIDETNLALKQVLGFTVGYYGSILLKTGNSSYAYNLSSNYFKSGLANIADANPEWGTSFNVSALSLGTNWYTNASYSEGNLNITYNLNGLGISDIAYSVSCQLNVQILPSPSNNQVRLTVTQDENEPVVDLSMSNFKFYSYQYPNSPWSYPNPPDEPASSSNGTYTIDVPPEINNTQAYAIQVQDSRGIIVAASSFSQITGSLTFNTTTVNGGDYVNNYNSKVDSNPDIGTHSNFAAQQSAPDGIYDSLTEANAGTQLKNYYPTSANPIEGTTLASGTIANLQSNDGAYMTFNSYPSAFSGSSTFGYSSVGTSSQSIENTITGSIFNLPTNAVAQNIVAHIQAASAQTFGSTTAYKSTVSIINTITGSQFAPTYNGVATSITAYIGCSSSAKNMEAAIYNNSNDSRVAQTNQQSVSTGTGWVTFAFSSGPSLIAGNTYILVIWSASGSSGTANLYYQSVSSKQGDSYSQTYDASAWPTQPSFTTAKNEYSIYCTYQPTAEVKAAIYSSTNAFIASTQQLTISATGWATFSFSTPQPVLAANTNYILVVWSNSAGGFTINYNTGSKNQGQSFSQTYGNWPTSPNFTHNNNEYSIYCGYSVPSQYSCTVEFLGSTSSPPLNWNNIIWTVDGSSTTSAGVTLQLFNYNTGQYATSGNGYITGTFGAKNYTEQQTITANAGNFRDDMGNWQLCLTATASVTSPFTINLNLVRYEPGSALYKLSLEEQWTNLNYTSLLHPALCVYAGTMGSNNLAVDAWYDGSWQPLCSSLVSGWDNMSINSYLTAGSTSFTIRFTNNSAVDNSPISWQVGAVLIRPESDQDLFLSLQSPAATVTVELLQNGTMIWLGQNLKITTQLVPILPVPVKAIHINETIDGVNQQVPFQIEDWASSYTVPLGLTNNATIFGNMQMIVFLVNTHVSAFTVWWNGSDQAIQTPLAYTNTYFTSSKTNDNMLSNGRLSIQLSSISSTLNVTSTVVGTSASSNAIFMRINTQPNNQENEEPDWVVVNGTVRDIVAQQVQFPGGVTNCSNVYADVVLTLPANATYFTYQLSLMFMPTNQTRTITDLCPIELSPSVGQLQTENGIAQGDPIVANGTQTFSSPGTWNHWSQFIDGTQGAGIMFTNQANQMLYCFDTPTTHTGALEANAATQPPTISLLPVTLNSVSFKNALDVTWDGAVVTFAGSAPPIYSGSDQPGLWILAEIPPTITVKVGN